MWRSVRNTVWVNVTIGLSIGTVAAFSENDLTNDRMLVTILRLFGT